MNVKSVFARAVVVSLAVSLPASAVLAQTDVMTFAGQGPTLYSAIAPTYGSHAGYLTVSNRSRTAFGNSAINLCDGTSHVDYWNTGYSNLTDVAFACADGLVGEFFFQPLAGKSVTLNSLDIGSYNSFNGVGPDRLYSVRAYDASWNPLLILNGTVNSAVHLNFGVTSLSGIYLQWGTDWNSGVDNISTTVAEPRVTAAPEPATLIILAPALLALGAMKRRRRA